MSAGSLLGSAVAVGSSRAVLCARALSATRGLHFRASPLSAKTGPRQWQQQAQPRLPSRGVRCGQAATAAAAAVPSAATMALSVEDEEEEEVGGVRRYPPFAAFRIHGTGRRKTAVARVGLIEGDGNFFVNGLPLNEYFQNQALLVQAVKLPLTSLGYAAKFDVVVKAHGGGLSAQAQAMMMGISRALVAANEANRSPLKAQGMLTRDSRAVERKKYGLKKARKAPQYSKR